MFNSRDDIPIHDGKLVYGMLIRSGFSDVVNIDFSPLCKFRINAYVHLKDLRNIFLKKLLYVVLNREIDMV